MVVRLFDRLEFPPTQLLPNSTPTGLARIMYETGCAEIKGYTPFYGAPEQRRACEDRKFASDNDALATYDPFKCDVFSFGQLLSVLLVGRPPTDKEVDSSASGGSVGRIGFEELNIRMQNMSRNDAETVFFIKKLAELCTDQDPKKRLSMEKVGSDWIAAAARSILSMDILRITPNVSRTPHAFIHAYIYTHTQNVSVGC